MLKRKRHAQLGNPWEMHWKFVCMCVCTCVGKDVHLYPLPNEYFGKMYSWPRLLQGIKLSEMMTISTTNLIEPMN